MPRVKKYKPSPLLDRIDAHRVSIYEISLYTGITYAGVYGAFRRGQFSPDLARRVSKAIDAILLERQQSAGTGRRRASGAAR